MEINDRGNSNKIALYSRKQVKAIEAFVEFYNHERNNDALDNIIAFKRIEQVLTRREIIKERLYEP